MDRWFFVYLTRALNHSVVTAIEYVAEEYCDIVTAEESEYEERAWELPLLQEAAMFTVAAAAENRDSEALVLAVTEYKFLCPDAAAWARDLLDVF